MSTSWDLSTAGTADEIVSIAQIHPNRATYGFSFNSTGSDLYLVGDLDDSYVVQISTAVYPTLTFPASLVEVPEIKDTSRRQTVSFYTLDSGVTVYLK